MTSAVASSRPPVAGHERRPGHDELAGRARDDPGAGVVDDADLRALQPPRGRLINRHRSLSSPSQLPPAEDVQLDAAQLARRRHQPHPLRQRINNMSS
jgi:hypothetical protein